tara:strand:+ start:864 stop:1130 length:267 start_codon:yes stop_codon:yes gene_type:complete
MNILKEDAIQIFGSNKNLSTALGIKHSAVSQWKAGEFIPAERGRQIRDLVEGRTSTEPLCESLILEFTRKQRKEDDALLSEGFTVGGK